MSSREFSQYSVGADADIARLEVANSPQITVKTVQSAGSMRRPQASFEAQPRTARLLAPKMGIDPYTETGSAWYVPRLFANQLHSAGRTESSTHTKQNDIDRDRIFRHAGFFDRLGQICPSLSGRRRNV